MGGHIRTVNPACAYDACAVDTSVNCPLTEANYYILRDIPQGKYSPQHMQDEDVAAEPKDVVARVK